jgi:hypothetical protein
MTGIIGIIALLTVLGLSLFITRLATAALAMTGLSYEAARFQARSAFTGTGFTTSETEKVVDHPVRRRIIMLLMTLRSAGLVTVILSLILSFQGSGSDRDALVRLGAMLGGVGLLWWAAKSRWFERYLSRIMRWALQRWTDLDTRDYASLLRLAGAYTVMELQVQEGDWLADRRLRDCKLPDEGVTVLGIYRDDGRYVGVPKAETSIDAGDTLVLYGRREPLRELGTRRADSEGQAGHEKAVSEQRRYEAEQDAQEAQYQRKRESRAIAPHHSLE